MQPIIDHSILAKTRAEEHSADVWGKFFVPPYFDSLSLKGATKSTYLVGKRGCGKTMLLKYLDYHTLFSPNRTIIPANEIEHIGIYWRVDTQFCNSMRLRGIEEAEWTNIFNCYFSLAIASEIIRSLKCVALSSYADFTSENLKRMSFNSAEDYSLPADPVKLEKALDKTRRGFSLWISNLSTAQRPLLPPGKDFLDSLILDIKNTPGLEKSCFYVYVDEVENLVPYQRRVLNTYLRHSQQPLIVSFTSKELSDENGTTGKESITATNDYNLCYIDNLMDDIERSCFFAEVFLANLDLAAGRQDSKLLHLVRDQNSLGSRREKSYKNDVIEGIKKRFPTKEHKQFAVEAFETARIKKILWDRVDKALARKSTALTADNFLKPEYLAEAKVILPALLNRNSNSAESILGELEKYSKGDNGKFSNWVHNNLFGSLLELYRPYRTFCPLYSGFDTFISMSNKNLRHFLILCYKVLEMSELEDDTSDVFSIEIQARAAYEAADQLIREIKTFGESGEQLRSFVLRLGNVFRTLQSAPSMSEPEQNQFTINSGDRSLDTDEMLFISEAQKYAILIEMLETKAKSTVSTDITDFQLNPIYSPYFMISYRRKRKVDFSVEDFHILSMGTEDEYSGLTLNLFKKSEQQDNLQLGLEL
jgi:hypothetical protein